MCFVRATVSPRYSRNRKYHTSGRGSASHPSDTIVDHRRSRSCSATKSSCFPSAQVSHNDQRHIKTTQVTDEEVRLLLSHQADDQPRPRTSSRECRMPPAVSSFGSKVEKPLPPRTTELFSGYVQTESTCKVGRIKRSATAVPPFHAPKSDSHSGLNDWLAVTGTSLRKRTQFPWAWPAEPSSRFNVVFARRIMFFNDVVMLGIRACRAFTHARTNRT